MWQNFWVDSFLSKRSSHGSMVAGLSPNEPEFLFCCHPLESLWHGGGASGQNCSTSVEISHFSPWAPLSLLNQGEHDVKGPHRFLHKDVINFWIWSRFRIMIQMVMLRVSLSLREACTLESVPSRNQMGGLGSSSPHLQVCRLRGLSPVVSGVISLIWFKFNII